MEIFIMESFKEKMKHLILSLLKKVLRKGNSLSSKIDALAVFLHKIYENQDSNFHRNGEYNVLKKLSEKQKCNNVIIDVGANKGDWSRLARKFFPHAIIHSFEIVPQTFRILVDNLGHISNIECYNIGLSDKEETTSVFFSPDDDELATCMPDFIERYHKVKPQSIEAKVTTGDKFCACNGIELVDFLKIDAEGFDHKVMQGFEGMLKQGQIKVIQFEYGHFSIDTHFLLKDFYDYLTAFNFRVGKIYPSYVDLREYQYNDENFYGLNYLAVHSSCKFIDDLLSLFLLNFVTYLSLIIV